MADEPQRIQLKRTKGWRLPDGVIVVTRPGKFGNPFKAAELIRAGIAEPVNARAASVELFTAWLDTGLGVARPPQGRARTILLAHLHQLRGRSLACWCSLPSPGQPDVCHAAVLMARANRPRTPERPAADGGRLIRTQRACNGCGEGLGDASDVEIQAAIAGRPLPDVRGECVRCGPEYAKALMKELARAGS